MAENHKDGRVIQIIGPAVDVEFEEGHLPAIYNAIRIFDDGTLGKVTIDVVVEVAQHIGENQVRCIAMKPTDGMVRGMKAIDLGSPISVPVGRATLGRILNVLGEPVDGLGPVTTEERWPIHREAPSFEEQSTGVEMFETGIKVIDLLEPYTKGGKTGLFGGAGVGKTVLIMELINNVAQASTAASPSSPASASARAKETTSISSSRRRASSFRATPRSRRPRSSTAR